MENKVQWRRRELKRRSRSVLHRHYWRIVLMTILMTILIGSNSLFSEVVQPFIEKVSSETTPVTVSYNSSSEEKKSSKEPETEDEEGSESADDIGYGSVAFLGTVVVALVIFSFLIFISVFFLQIFIINPISVGIMRFYIRCFDGKPFLKEMFHVFEHRYKNVVGIMFLKDLYTFFWFLLFVVPGIVKSYEYSMVPYLLAENPNLMAKEAFALSRQMMRGQKWKAFVLDVSFLGWNLLSLLTFGILGIFFVDPYVKLTGAALYRKLRGSDEIPENIYFDGMDYDSVKSCW